MNRVVDKLNFLQQNHRTINEAAQRGRFRGAETTAEVVDHSVVDYRQIALRAIRYSLSFNLTLIKLWHQKKK